MKRGINSVAIDLENEVATWLMAFLIHVTLVMQKRTFEKFIFTFQKLKFVPSMTLEAYFKHHHFKLIGF